MSQAIQQIPMSKLITSDANVRRTNRMNGVSELAASIKAHGLLQNLTVRRVTEGKEKIVLFEVIAGGRRLAALKSLVKAKQMKKDSRIACHVLNGEIAEEISLAENAHEPMHPAMSSKPSPNCRTSMAWARMTSQPALASRPLSFASASSSVLLVRNCATSTAQAK